MIILRMEFSLAFPFMITLVFPWMKTKDLFGSKYSLWLSCSSTPNQCTSCHSLINIKNFPVHMSWGHLEFLQLKEVVYYAGDGARDERVNVNLWDVSLKLMTSWFAQWVTLTNIDLNSMCGEQDTTAIKKSISHNVMKKLFGFFSTCLPSTFNVFFNYAAEWNAFTISPLREDLRHDHSLLWPTHSHNHSSFCFPTHLNNQLDILICFTIIMALMILLNPSPKPQSFLTP